MTADSDLSYVTSDGDMLDAIVARHYGDTQGGKVETVLDSNPGLAARGPVYPAGIRIILPPITAPRHSETEQLWG